MFNKVSGLESLNLLPFKENLGNMLNKVSGLESLNLLPI